MENCGKIDNRMVNECYKLVTFIYILYISILKESKLPVLIFTTLQLI